MSNSQIDDFEKVWDVQDLGFLFHGIENKLNKFRLICGTNKTTLINKFISEIKIYFYKVMAVLALL